MLQAGHVRLSNNTGLLLVCAVCLVSGNMEGSSGSYNEGAGRGHTCSGEIHCFRATNPFMGKSSRGPSTSYPPPYHYIGS